MKKFIFIWLLVCNAYIFGMGELPIKTPIDEITYCMSRVESAQEKEEKVIELIEQYLKNGGDIDYWHSVRDKNLLNFAVCCGCKKVVNFLLKNNARIDAGYKYKQSIIPNAIRFPEIVEILMHAGASKQSISDAYERCCKEIESSERNLSINRANFTALKGTEDKKFKERLIESIEYMVQKIIDLKKSRDILVRYISFV